MSKPRITNNVLDGVATIIKMVPASEVINNKNVHSAVKYLTNLIEYGNSTERRVRLAKVRAAYESRKEAA